MAAFFANRRGDVVRVTGQYHQAGGVLPFRISMAGMDITDQSTRAIITQSGIVENGNFQFLHTLNQTIYAYVFGDRIGELRVGGVCFADPCPIIGPQLSGMAQIIKDYRANRIALKSGPVSVSFGEIDYIGFLVGMTLEINDPERMLGQWAFRFNTFPGNQQ